MREFNEMNITSWRLKPAAIIIALTIIVAAFLAFGLSSTAKAEDTSSSIASINCDDKTYYPSTFKDINQELARLKGKSVTINMYRDWNARDTSAGVSIPEHLVIPSGSRVTLNMNGYMIDRGLSGDAKDMSVADGEVILVQSGATLIINGGSDDEAKGRSHEAYVYTSTEPSGFVAPSKKQFSGGLITGGNGKNGAGGIRMLKGSTAMLDDVTIAGCRNQAATITEGAGGGVRMEGGGGSLTLYDSIITGCFANNGGGVYVDTTGKATIDLESSHVDGNYAKQDGGGIYLYGKDSSVVGYDGSTVSGNFCQMHGGGIHAFGSKALVMGIAVRENHAADGGGICTRSDATTLHNLVIEKNVASSRGGGAYIVSDAATNASYEGDCEISDCTVQNNTAQACGGLCFDDYTNQHKDRKRLISGKMIVKENTSNDGGIRDLRIETDAWGHKRESFALTEGAEVWAGFQAILGQTIAADVQNATVTDGKCAEYLHSEHSGYVLQFDLEKRFIDLILESDARTKPIAQPVEAADANNASGKNGGAVGSEVAGKVGTVSAGGNDGGVGYTDKEYDLIRGFFMHDNETDIAAFYFSDGLFYGNPYTYNTHLATLSWAWAYSAGYLNQHKDAASHESTGSKDPSTYYNKHAAARQFLADIGCSDQDIYVNDSMVSQPGTDTIGVAIGSKKLQHYVNGKLEDTGDILIPVAVRGMGYETEWASNVTLDTATDVPGGEARGFADAANQVVKEIEYYLKKYNLEGKLENGQVKFWVTGFSRAGATANLTSKRLVEKISEISRVTGKRSQVFGYPCEAPKGGTDNAEQLNDKTFYYCIHNMVNKVDVVPYVAPEQMGFKRYGVDHYIPGTNAGEIKKTVKQVNGGGTGGPTAVTTYADNEPTLTKTEEYKTQKTEMLKQLLAVDGNFVFDDHFRPKAFNFLTLPSFETMRIYDEPSNNDNDGFNKAEYFVEDFMRFLQQGSPKRTWGKAASSRDAYAKTAYTLGGKTYPTTQVALRDLMKIFQSTTGGGMTGFLNKAGNIKTNIPSFSVRVRWALGDNEPAFSMASLYFQVIGNWHKLDDKQRSYWTTTLWNAFKKTGALEELSADDRAKFEASFPTILNLAFTFVDADYDYKPKNNESNGFPVWAKGSSETMMYTPTFSEHASYILSCHMPEVNTAWVRSYDSWFIDGVTFGDDERNGYTLKQPSSVAAPTASYKAANGSLTALSEGAENSNRLQGDQKIVLDNDGIVGEAIYYDLVDTASGKTLAKNQIYRGGVDLTLDGASSKNFQLKTYDMSYGVASVDATYNIELGSSNHSVIVNDLPKTASSITADYRTRTFSFAEGEKAVVQADVPDDLFFKQWKVVSKKADGTDAYHEADLADEVFKPNDKLDADNSFTMPASSSDSVKFPAGYQLQLTAQYGTRISSVETRFAEIVKAGAALPDKVTVALASGMDGQKTAEYDVAWSYKDSNGKAIPVSIADSSIADSTAYAYKNTEYMATITIPQDIKNEIAFASSVAVSSTNGAPVASSVTRSNADGSITVQVKFEKTGTDAGADRPDSLLTFKVMAYDLNTGQRVNDTTDVELSGPSEQWVRIVAPEVANEQFVGWDLEGTGITPFDTGDYLKNRRILVKMPTSQEGVTNPIKATYVPLVKKVEVNLLDAQGSLFEPKSGKSNFANAQVFVTVTNEYEINPANLQVSWSPALSDDDTYDTMTDYVATVKIVPDANTGKVQTKLKGGEGDWQDVTLSFIPSDDMQAMFNESDQDLDVDEDGMAMSKVFPMTQYTLAAVRQPANIEGVPYGTGEEGIRALLPTTTQILATNGFEVDAEIEWGVINVVDGAGDAYDSKVWQASGAVKQPSNFENPNDVSLGVSVYVTVGEADTAIAPEASLDSGTYLYDQSTTLTTHEQGGRTYYTMDGSDPSDVNNANRVLYEDGEEILVSRFDAELEKVPVDRMKAASEDAEDTYTYADRKVLYIRAYTEAEGKRESAVSIYRYEFSDIPVPEGVNYDYDGQEHIGVEAGPYYMLSLEPGSRARIDEYGNVVATVPGTYKVTATLLLGDDSWELSDGTTSKANQTIEFTIAGDPLSEDEICDIEVEAVPVEAGTVIGGGSYVKGQTVEVMAWANDGYEFVNWMLDGRAVSSDSRYEFTAQDDCKLVANFKLIDSPYYCAEGSGSTWTKGSSEALAFTFKRAEADETTFERFTGIEIDGVAVPEKDDSGAQNYTSESGSVIISLQPSFLETLSEGDHTLKAAFNDGDAQAAFTVAAEAASASDSSKDKTVPKTGTTTSDSSKSTVKSGDSLALTLVVALLVFAALAAVVAFVARKKRAGEHTKRKD